MPYDNILLISRVLKIVDINVSLPIYQIHCLDKKCSEELYRAHYDNAMLYNTR